MEMVTWQFVVIVVMLALIIFFGGSNYDGRLYAIQNQLDDLSRQLRDLEVMLKPRPDWREWRYGEDYNNNPSN